MLAARSCIQEGAVTGFHGTGQTCLVVFLLCVCVRVCVCVCLKSHEGHCPPFIAFHKPQEFARCTSLMCRSKSPRSPLEVREIYVFCSEKQIWLWIHYSELHLEEASVVSF